jgi:hypothetical protein
MPKLKDYRETKDIELPASGAKVTVYQSLLAKDIESIRKEGEDTSVIRMVEIILKDWDFFDDNDEKKKSEINQENIGQLDMKDLIAIFNQSEIEDFLEEENASSLTNKSE